MLRETNGRAGVVGRAALGFDARIRQELSGFATGFVAVEVLGAATCAGDAGLARGTLLMDAGADWAPAEPWKSRATQPTIIETLFMEPLLARDRA
jgi:hypothetical protein